MAPISAPSDVIDPSTEAPDIAKASLESLKKDVVDTPIDASGKSIDAPADSPEIDELTMEASEEPSSSRKKAFDALTSTSLRSQLLISAIFELVIGIIFL